MDDPFNTICRINGWKTLLKELILLNRIESFIINTEGTHITIYVDDSITYYIDFISICTIKYLFRESCIDKLLKN